MAETRLDGSDPAPEVLDALIIGADSAASTSFIGCVAGFNVRLFEAGADLGGI